MGQGFFGYNPPDFIINAAKAALDKVDCNQYSPTKGRPRLKKAIADSYSPLWGRKLDPETEVTITTGANEGGEQHVYIYEGNVLISGRNVECFHGVH
jgi:kynurenine aminotransferase